MEAFTYQRSNTAFVFALVFLSWISVAHCIGCFKCVSIDGRFSACDDPFNNNHSLLEAPCMGGLKDSDEFFPATSCIKIVGVFDDTGESITVRGCGLDSGTRATENIRRSHCDTIYYHDRLVHGCLQSCNDADACNSSNKIKPFNKEISLLLALHAALVFRS